MRLSKELASTHSATSRADTQVEVPEVLIVTHPISIFSLASQEHQKTLDFCNAINIKYEVI